MEYVNQFVDRCADYCADMADDSWNWFNGLHREEWMVVLAVAAASGFLCMLGHSIRK